MFGGPVLSLLLVLTTVACTETAGDKTAEKTEVKEFEDAHFSVSMSMSPTISTVAIVTFVPKDFTPKSAIIEFGPTDEYQWTAPVNLNGPQNRTVLLGMKPEFVYHFRIVAKTEQRTYTSEDYTIKTGHLPTNLPNKTVKITAPKQLENGFMMACTFLGEWAFILDEDGDYVWWHHFSNGSMDCVRVTMDASGENILVANGNVPGPNSGLIVKISTDGTQEETIDIPKRHHDLVVLPDNTIAYMEYDDQGKGVCDRVLERSPDGAVREVFSVRNQFIAHATSEEWCHSNALNYSRWDETYTLSILHLNTIIKFSRSGELIWTFGGPDSDFENLEWNGQHQHHIIGNRLWLFNNFEMDNNPFSSKSRVLEFTFDEIALKATQTWEYSSGSMTSFSMGDVSRLINNNTLVTFSTAGQIHEVTPSGALIKKIAWDMGSSVGYVTWRYSLYYPNLF